MPKFSGLGLDYNARRHILQFHGIAIQRGFVIQFVFIVHVYTTTSLRVFLANPLMQPVR